MNLKEYLIQNNVSVTDIAKICNITAPTIYRILKGCHVNKHTARRIFKKTNKQVKLREDIS